MSWDSVPWFVGGGAEHSPEVARLLAYAATSGAEGVVSPGDLKVLPLNVPGSSVRVSLGAALIRNRAAGGTAQTYVARNPIEDVVAIAATGSGGGRSDLIVAQIEDPFMAGEPWQDPADPKVGPYIFTRVISNVPAGTTSLQGLSGYRGRSAVVLARIDLPASTGTVTAGMIVDLRKVALPRSSRALSLQAGTVAQLNATTEVSFPQNRLAVAIPEWATRLTGVVTANGILQFGADEAMTTRVRLGSSLYSAASVTDQDANAGDAQTRITLFGFTFDVPPEMRGTTQQLTFWSRRLYAGSTGRFASNLSTQIAFDVFFEEATT